MRGRKCKQTKRKYLALILMYMRLTVQPKQMISLPAWNGRDGVTSKDLDRTKPYSRDIWVYPVGCNFLSSISPHLRRHITKVGCKLFDGFEVSFDFTSYCGFDQSLLDEFHNWPLMRGRVPLRYKRICETFVYQLQSSLVVHIQVSSSASRSFLQDRRVPQ